jgi:tetratricopeptide (TPR) repeat protein
MLQLLLTGVAIVWLASPVLASDEKDCFQGYEPQLRIKGCSDIIERSPDDATAYHNRAFAYELAGDLDDAIADYSKVIALAPSNASAYVNRGRAYASKGDHIHAVEDDARAHALIAKAATQLPAPTSKPERLLKRAMVAVAKPTIASPKKKRIARASNKVGGKTLTKDPWAWLWGNGADKASSRGTWTARERVRKS